jgi:hypothetical protein
MHTHTKSHTPTHTHTHTHTHTNPHTYTPTHTCTLTYTYTKHPHTHTHKPTHTHTHPHTHAHSQIPITKPGKENSTEVSKFRPISLINVGGKISEKKTYKQNYASRPHQQPNESKPIWLHPPKKNAIDAATAVKKYIEEGLRERHITILVSLDVKGAFDAAWWPNILKTLKEF